MKHTARHLLAPVALAASLLVATSAQAALLQLPNYWPDLQLSGLSIEYIKGDGSFTVQHTATSNFDFSTDGFAFSTVTSASYSIDAQIDNDGNLISGSLNVMGAISDLGIGETTLLSGNLAAFGFHDDGSFDAFDFEVTGLSGDLASYYGSSLYLLISSASNSTNFTGSFNNNFTGSGNYIYANNLAIVPVPAAVWLLGSGLFSLVAFARRHRR
jgi:hypothetical protein